MTKMKEDKEHQEAIQEWRRNVCAKFKKSALESEAEMLSPKRPRNLQHPSLRPRPAPSPLAPRTAAAHRTLDAITLSLISFTPHTCRVFAGVP